MPLPDDAPQLWQRRSNSPKLTNSNALVASNTGWISEKFLAETRAFHEPRALRATAWCSARRLDADRRSNPLVLLHRREVNEARLTTDEFYNLRRLSYGTALTQHWLPDLILSDSLTPAAPAVSPDRGGVRPPNWWHEPPSRR